MAYLYALCDEQGFARYIGSSSDPWNRYGSHVSRFAALAVREWVAGLDARGEKPTLIILGEVDDARRYEAEAELIRCLGGQLVNNSTGPRRRKEAPSVGASRASVALREALDSRGLTQAEGAKLIGALQSVISRVVRGHRRPGRSLAVAIEKEFGVPADWWDVAMERIASTGEAA